MQLAVAGPVAPTQQLAVTCNLSISCWQLSGLM